MAAGTRRRLLTGAVATLAVAGLAGGAAMAIGGDRTEAVRDAVQGGQARNLIFLLGDGMGEAEITAARDYQYGAAGKLPGIDRLPLTGDVKTWSIYEAPDDPTLNGKPDYDPDSASTGTAWATGLKTRDGRISTSITDRRLRTILELAQRGGYVTGNVTTAELTDATPAVLDSHINVRDCQGPADMAACPQYVKPAGPGSIAEQTVDHQVDVLMGGGKQRFDQTVVGGRYDGQTVLQQATAKGYQVVTTADDLDAVPPSARGKLLGLFAPGTMTTEWNGILAGDPPTGPQRCDEAYRATTSPTQPSLPAMTAKALALLDQKAAQPGVPGFFLQVEGASIDKQDHAANPCGQIGETVEFDQAVQLAMAYAHEHPDTLVITTADHAHSSQIVDDPDAPTGAVSILTTTDGTPLYISYGTAPIGASQQHTGATVRVAAMGPQAANVVGLIDNTDLFEIMKRALGL